MIKIKKRIINFMKRCKKHLHGSRVSSHRIIANCKRKNIWQNWGLVFIIFAKPSNLESLVMQHLTLYTHWYVAIWDKNERLLTILARQMFKIHLTKRTSLTSSCRKGRVSSSNLNDSIRKSSDTQNVGILWENWTRLFRKSNS